LFGQFSDDFSDGNLDGWQGNVPDFIVNGNQQMQLNAPSGSTTTWINTPVTFSDSTVWELYFKLDFAPSTSNQLKIYLCLTSDDLSTASGYFLEIGASGDQDALDLKYLDQGATQTIGSSTPALVAAEPVELRIRITKKSNGLWECYKLSGTVPELLFTASHDILTISTLSIFGFNCKYTDTRRDKFYFDDINIQPVVADVIAPLCTSVSVLDANSVRLDFNEPLNGSSTQAPGNYLLTPGNTTPDSITAGQQDITIRWNQPFTSQQPYTLILKDVKDVAGNVMAQDSKVFTYLRIDQALPYELLVTEIMADPTPVLGLPDAEYLELFNTTSKIFNLGDYTIQVGSTQRTLPDEIITGGEYVILCSPENVEVFSAFGRVIIVNPLPALTNTGASILLKDNNDVVLHDVTYSYDWYGDPSKSNGGWSLEMQNPFHICSDITNWTAAQNLIGGTPGTVNSQWYDSPDMEGPEFISLFVSTPDKIKLRFSERLDGLLMENPNAFTVLPATGISNVMLINPTTVELSLAQPLEEGIIYQFLPFTAYDCIGNSALFTDTLIFGLTTAPEAGDVLINELLFNPASGGSRYIEVINVSQKFIKLSSLAIGRISAIHNDIFPTGIDEIIEPGAIAALTPDPSDIMSRYVVPHPSKVYDATLPSWDDQSDNVSLLAGGIIIDSFTYFSSWHLPVIADQNGVSLERVSSGASTFSPSTWHSASSVSGYGTPTGPNSQMIIISGQEESPFTVTNRQFSPNEDGYKDFLALNFLLTSGEEIGSIWIYDLEGREIARLIDNESLGTSTIVQWDGRTSESLLAEMGIYVIFIQLWDAKGNVSQFQETCALVKR
jgi:hypothetical protein